MKLIHTPGPWILVHQSGAGPIVAHPFETGKQMQPTGLRIIASMLERGNTLVEDKANANLIASAPDLLVACEAMRRLHYDEGKPSLQGLEAIQLADLAIAKAKGQP